MNRVEVHTSHFPKLYVVSLVSLYDYKIKSQLYPLLIYKQMMQKKLRGENYVTPTEVTPII